MLLPVVLFALVLTGCWLYCLADAALTPADAFPGWRKRAWLIVIAVTLIAGAVAWMIASRNWRPQRWSPAAANLIIIERRGEGIVWYPSPPDGSRSGPSGPIGPDDDPEFLRELAQRIQGNSTGTGE
jgi:general stress protein CsbA